MLRENTVIIIDDPLKKGEMPELKDFLRLCASLTNRLAVTEE